jgi:hypothetical protein
MIKLGHLQQGDIVLVNDDGLMREGIVVGKDVAEHSVHVDNGVQEFWYQPQDLFPIALDEAQLMKFGFEKEEINGAVKYKKGVFRLVIPQAGDFSNIEMWYREDRRHFKVPIAVHELQNLHMSMSKIQLERP